MHARVWLTTVVTMGMLVGCGTAKDDGAAMEESALTSGVLTVTASEASSWNAGYCENVVVANGGTAPVTSWTVVLSLGNATLGNGWSGSFTASGNSLTVTPLSWNSTIAAGQSTSFGFCANASAASSGATVVSASASGGGSASGSSTTSATSSTSRSSSSSVVSSTTSTSSSSRSTTSSSSTSTTSTTSSSTRSTSSSSTTSSRSSSSTSTSTSSSSSTTTGGGGACTWASGPSSNNGELTCYWFGQGTASGGGCPSYKTFCGYCGSESGGGGGVCPTGISDTVSNIATPYFAAFPVGTFGQGTYCGMCVDVSYGGRSITATIVDECATCPSTNHIDLGLSAAVALGLGQNGATGDPTNGVTWKAVDCPVGGDIVAVFNNGYSGQVYFQNVAFPVKSASANGQTATQSFGYWDFHAAVAGATVTLTDGVGHTITGKIPSNSGGSIGAQFPASCQ